MKTRRKHGVSKYGGVEASDVQKLREIEEKNDKLKRMFANLSLENAALKDLIAKMANSNLAMPH